MRKLNNYLLLGLMSLFCITLTVGCGEDPTSDTPVVTKDSVIKLKESVVTANFGGGVVYAEYTIENPHSGEQVTATADAAWVSDIDCSITGAVKFNVAANNENSGRECTVTIKYRYAEDVTLTVRQGTKLNATFTIENLDASDYYSYTLDVIPSEKTKPFIIMSGDVEYVADLENGGTDEDLYQDDMAYFEYLGALHGESLIDIINVRARLGNQRGITIGKGTPGMTYVFYAYYIDLQTGARLSDVTRFEITIGHPALSEVDFEFDYEVNGPAAWTEALPTTTVEHYYFDVITTAELDWAAQRYGYTKEQYIKRWWAGTVVNMMNDMTIDQIVATSTCVGTNDDGTPRSQWVYELAAGTEYHLFAFTLDAASGLATSVPVYTTFTTGMPKMSDNVITVDVTEITSYTARLNFTATNDDYYVAGWETADLWASYGNNDAERMEYLLANFGYEYIVGNTSYVETKLAPETDYVAYAFGMHGGIPTTTKIFTKEFTTRAANAGAVDISLRDLGYYDPSDLAKFPGYEMFGNSSYQPTAIVPIEFVFTSPDHGKYALLCYDWDGKNWEYDDEQYMGGIINAFNTGQNITVTHTYYLLPWDHRCVFVAVVIDNDGNYSSLYKQEMTCTFDGVSDPEIFVEWWDAYQSSADTQSLVIAEPSQQSVEVSSLFRQKSNNTQFRASETVFENTCTPEVDELCASR